MSHLTTRPRYVYVVSAEFGPVKIGSSCEPNTRATQVRSQRNSPFLTVRATYLRPDALEIEFAAHKILRHRRRGRVEWFDCTVTEAKNAIERAIAEKDATT